jgi:hypothetical protein
MAMLLKSGPGWLWPIALESSRNPAAGAAGSYQDGFLITDDGKPNFNLNQGGFMTKREKAEYLARKLFKRKLNDYHWKIVELLNRPESYLDEYIERARRYELQKR